MKHVLWFAAVFLVTCSAASAQDFMADRHLKRGATCADCHGTSVPSPGALVDMSSCLKCHGSYDKVAALTQSLGGRNPHDAHIGQLDCTVCHHGHSEPVLYCSNCHTDLNLKTP
jgi:hypothetical protein